MASTLTHPPPPSTQADRLRWADLVRAASLGIVVLGHYLMALVVVESSRTGTAVSASALLDETTWSHPLTWVVQVMGCFFAVGAVVVVPRFADNLPSVAEWRAYMGPRARSLVVPAVPLLVAWWLAGPLLAGVIGVDLADAASRAAVVPLWFLAVYLLLQAGLPVAAAAVRLAGVWRTVGLLLVVAGIVDAMHLAGVPMVGWLNFPVVWMVPTVLGAAVGMGRVAPRQLALAGLSALVSAVLLTVVAGYPVPLVGVTGAARSNNFPPSLLLAVHALAYASLVMWGAPRLGAWLGATSVRRRRLSQAGQWSMAIYLWHMTGMIVLIAAAVVLPLPLVDPLLAIEPLTVAWWSSRPLFVALALGMTIVVIAVVAGPTRAVVAWSSRHGLPHPSSIAVATLAGAAGITSSVVQGTARPPWLSMILIVLALVALHPTGGEHRRTPKAAGPPQ